MFQKYTKNLQCITEKVNIIKILPAFVNICLLRYFNMDYRQMYVDIF